MRERGAALIDSRDAVVQAIRLDLRQLAADRLNFEISRQSLIVAARQVEQARIMLVEPGRAAQLSMTQNVLDALNQLLEAKDALVAIWVAYETDRLRLQAGYRGACSLMNGGLPAMTTSTPSPNPLTSKSSRPSLSTVSDLGRVDR